MIDKSQQFNSYLNKIIIGTARRYYKEKLKLYSTEEFEENTNDKTTVFTDEHSSTNDLIDKLETKIVLDDAIERLSALEQAVIFLLFTQGESQIKAAKELKLYDTSVSRINKRAIKRLKELLNKGDFLKWKIKNYMN